MTHSLPAVRNELPSPAEVWSIFLGALMASALLASAFRLTVAARGPLTEEEPAITAQAAERRVLVKPEPRPPAAKPAPARNAANDVGEAASR